MAKTYIDQNGYRRYVDSNKLVSRHIAEKKLGRKLKSEEVVHHKDRNKQNNSPNNLWVFPNQKAHDRVHKYDAKRYGHKASYKGFNSRKTEDGCMLNIMIIISVFVLIYLF